MNEESPLIGRVKTAPRSSNCCRCGGTEQSCEDAEVVFSRWQSFSSICFFVSVAGITYAFGVYSLLLKTKLGFSQSSLDYIASAGNSGLYLSIISGALLQSFGLRFVIYLGSSLIFIGFLYIYLAVELILPANAISIGLFFFLSQYGVNCYISSAVTMSIKLFPPHKRGAAVGLTKGYFGISTAVLGVVSAGYFSKNPQYFLLFIAIAVPLFGKVSITWND
jgi:hypothetical protein